MKTMYLVKYTTGSYEDEQTTHVFCTSKKSTATKYCTKFNKLLYKWDEYYSQFEELIGNIRWLSHRHSEKHYNRWSSLRKINRCHWEQVEIR